MPHPASSSTDIALASSDLARGPGSVRAVPSAAEAMRAFAADLLESLQPGQDNLVCSPYSIAAALAMARNGARGATADEMDEVLHAPAMAEFNGGLNALTRQIEAMAGERTRADGTSAQLTLDVANSLWGQQGTSWEPAFLDTLAEHYGAGMRIVDFAAATEVARVRINDWVERRTHDRIQDLLAPGVLDTMTRLVLVNAIYLKAPWEVTFDAALTRPRPFTRADGSTVQPDTMSGMLRGLSYARGDGWQAARLPYAGGQLAMTVVLPDGRDTSQLEADLSGAGLHGILTAAEPVSMLALELPKFEFRTSVQLNEPLSALGMPTAFDPSAADFGAMATELELYIQAVVHQAFIAVDEEGTEAAAATAVVMGTTSLPQVTPLTVDKPFLFVIHDVEHSTPLFLGRVSDPTA